jgi:hypothetical protein
MKDSIFIHCGVDTADYFPGVSADSYEHVFVGVGNYAKDAAEDALEQALIAQLQITEEELLTLEAKKDSFLDNLIGLERAEVPYPMQHYVALFLTL